MENLEITQESLGNEILLKCSGRLDANRAGHLDDHIESIIREGSYFISLDLSGIQYLSSAGIRSLVSQYKNLKSVNGHFYIRDMSDSVAQVLDMVGMKNLLTELPGKQDAESADREDHQERMSDGFRFTLTLLNASAKSKVSLYGHPSLVQHSDFGAQQARIVQSAENHFALGLGAIGDTYEACENLFGEYMMLGKNVVYLPTDGSGKPDYMVSTGKLVASLVELYGVHFTGEFSHMISFEQTQNDQSVGLSEITKQIQALTGYGRFVVVILAESGGLVGTSLRVSPVDGEEVFSYPQVKEKVQFTTEPVHNKMLAVSAGLISHKAYPEAAPFLRKLDPEASILGHVHASIFPYVALKKTDVDLEETINYLLNHTELRDVMHLTYDTRDIIGLGESQFVQGFCWVAPVESIEMI